MKNKVTKNSSKLQNAQREHQKIVELAKRLVIMEDKMITGIDDLSEAEREEYETKLEEFWESDAGTPCPGCFLNEHEIAVPETDRDGSEI